MTEEYEIEVRIILKKPKYFPNLKKKLYKDLTEQIENDTLVFVIIDADEFMVAALLPVQRFKKASSAEVWKDSRSMI